MTRPISRAVWAPAVAFAVVAIIALSIWHSTQKHEAETLRLKTDLTTEQVALRLEEFIGVRLAIVAHFQELWRRNQINTPEQFSDYALYILKDFRGLQAVNWVDREGVIRWVVPDETNRQAKDKDLKLHPEAAETFLSVMRTGTPHLTPPITLLQGGKGIAAYFPLVRDGKAEGYLNAVFRTEALVGACLGDALFASFAAEVRDGGRVAFTRGGSADGNARAPHAERSFRVLDRTWTLVMTPAPALIAATGTYVDDLSLAVGFLLAAGLALLLRRLHVREAALVESRARYKAIFENAQAGLVRIDDTTGRVLEGNLAAAELCGYATREEFSREFVVLERWFDPADRARMYEGVAAGDGRLNRFEARFRRKDGSPVWVRASVCHVPEMRCFEAVLVGIDEEKTSLLALEESRRRYKSIFDNVQVGLFRISTAGGKVLDANRRMAEIYGFDSAEEMVRDYAMAPNWVVPAERDRMYAEFGRGRGMLSNFEAQFKRRDGTPVWVRFSAQLSPARDYMEGVGISIDEEKKAVQALVDSEKKFRALADSTSAAILIIRGEQIIYANPASLRQLGYDAEKMHGTHPNALLTPESAAALQRYGDDWMAGRPVPPALELEAATSDGSRRWIEMTIGPLDIEGDLAIVTTSFDITERRRAEEARRVAEQQMFRADKMAALGQIIAGVAHEINNPNNFIYFNLPILKRYLEAIKPHLDECAGAKPGLTILNMPYEEFMADTFKLLENMQHGSSRITEIVAELKDYIRSHEADEKKPEGLERIVDRVMTLVGKQVRKTVKRLDVEVPADLPKICVHAGKIEQVLINILINAGQAADKDDARVALTAARSTRAPGRVEIVIEDNGTGIASEHVARIFDPFFTTKGRDAGTGLGLAISQKIVEDHGGAIRVESEPGRGTRFIVELPAATEAA